MNSNFDGLPIADRIGSRLCRDSHWSGETCCWAGWLPAERPVYGSLGSSLYSGSAGIGLFLAHLAKATGDRLHAAHARAALESARRRFAEERLGDGLFSGAAGVAYALLAGGQALGETRWHEDAIAIFHALPVEPPAAAGVDVISGLAGIMLGLHWAAGQGFAAAELAGRAQAYGEEIVRRATAIDGGIAWPGDPKSELAPLLGFAHGTSGILNALGAHEVFRTAVENALDFEAAHFDGSQSNWPDYRTGGTAAPAFMSGWCHGAPGIALAYLSCPAATPHLTAALENTMESLERLTDARDGNYSLCHGACGNADILLSAALHSGDRNYLDAAVRAAETGRERIHLQDAAWPCGRPASLTESPQLMTGIAGIGLFYLRISDSGLESILDLGRAFRNCQPSQAAIGTRPKRA